MNIDAQRWNELETYLHDVFGQQDDHLTGLMPEAIAAGIPDIAVSAEVGRLLMMLTNMTAGRLAIEVGTLAGYSGIWIARGLREGGQLLTIECEPKHAAFARAQFEQAGVQDRVTLIEGDAREVLADLARRLEPGSVDVVFLDAAKEEYPAYWDVVRPLIAVGGLILCDNALGSNAWWIGEPGHPARDAMDAVNRMVANDDEFDAVGIPLRQGVLVGRRHRRATTQ